MQIETLSSLQCAGLLTADPRSDLTYHYPTSSRDTPILFQPDPLIYDYQRVMTFPTPTLVMTGFGIYESKDGRRSSSWDDYTEHVEIRLEQPVRILVKDDQGGMRLQGPFLTKEGATHGDDETQFQVNLVYRENNPLMVYVGIRGRMSPKDGTKIIVPKLQSIYGPGMLIR